LNFYKLVIESEPLLTISRYNEQKLFYGLLLKHREAALENYTPEVGYSSSDYHHVRPLANVPRYSSRQFSQPATHGHGRQISRFTVVSNVTKAETEATGKSYDPYRASRPHNFISIDGTATANVVVHRGRPSLQEIRPSPRPKRKTSLSSSGARNRQQSLAPPKTFASRSSLASSTRSRGSGRGMRAGLGNKRGVSFSHIRRGSGPSRNNMPRVQQQNWVSQRHGKLSENTDGEGDMLRSIMSPSSTRYIHSRKSANSATQPHLSAKRTDRGTRLWQEDVRQLSSSLAKDCDEAFNRTSAISTAATNLSSRDEGNEHVYETPVSSFVQNEGFSDSIFSAKASHAVAKMQPNDKVPWDTRPLPAPPTRSDSVNIELAEARKQAQQRRWSGDESPGYINRMVSHLDRLIQPGSSPLRQKGDRRTTSAPVQIRTGHEAGRHLPSIVESPIKDQTPAAFSDFEQFIDMERVRQAGPGRITSAPEARTHRPSYHDDRIIRQDNRRSDGTRVGISPTPSPAKAPAPLNIRKKPSQEAHIMTGALPASQLQDVQSPIFGLNQQYTIGNNGNWTKSTPHMEREALIDNATYSTVRNKKSAWFKRSSRSEGLKSPSLGGNSEYSQVPYSNDDADQIGKEKGQYTKKKSFGFGRIFGKMKPESAMSMSCKCH
jgi:serine/threonine-protein kinase HSL1 (negative regulator of Swe1 kinase)